VRESRFPSPGQTGAWSASPVRGEAVLHSAEVFGKKKANRFFPLFAKKGIIESF
jgi:hypothetical protein